MALHSANSTLEPVALIASATCSAQAGYRSRNSHGHHDVRLLNQILHRRNIPYAGLPGQCPRTVAAALQAGENIQLMLSQSLPDRVPHVAGTQYGYRANSH